MGDDSTKIRNKLRTQSVEPHRMQTRHDTYVADFRRKHYEEGDVAELFHENTKYAVVGPKFRRSIAKFTNDLDRESSERLTPTASRGDLTPVELPEPTPVDGSITDVVRRRRSCRQYSGEELSLEHLSTILKYGCGTLRPSPNPDTDGDHWRGYPSAGALYPVEPYLVVSNVAGLSEGIYYYSAANHELKVVEEMQRERMLDEVEPKLNPPQGTQLKNVALAFLLTGAFWKTKVKYGPRGYRFALLEAGHLAQNVQLVSASLGVESCGLGGTKETELDPLLGANGVDESTVYGFVVGYPSSGGETDG